MPLLPERGRIFDADGRIMADNQRVLTVAVDWSVMRRDKDRAEIFRRLSGWINVPVEDMEERFQSQVYSPFLPMPVAEDVDERTATAIQERVEDLPGVSIVEESRRVYPYAPLASHVVGYMGRITADTKDAYTNGRLLPERTGRPVRRRAEHGGRAARQVGLRHLRGRQRQPDRPRGRHGSRRSTATTSS